MGRKNTFISQNGGLTYVLVDGDPTKPTFAWPLPPAIYNLEQEPSMGLYLRYYKDKFDFSFNKYPIDDDFINHVLKRYPSMKKNMGILLNGKKGTGKSVIAKTIANELNLPVIIIGHLYGNELIDFISKITFPCVFFIDEFEKIYRNNDEGLLSVMDGVYTGNVPHVFLLTTNELVINNNFLARPGRILYRRTYGNLNKEFIDTFIDDNLVNKNVKDDLIFELSTLKSLTIDVVKSIIEEINITGITPHQACGYMNVDRRVFYMNYTTLRFCENDREADLFNSVDITKFKQLVKSFEEEDAKDDDFTIRGGRRRLKATRDDDSLDIESSKKKIDIETDKLLSRMYRDSWRLSVNVRALKPNDEFYGDGYYNDYDSEIAIPYVVLENHDDGKYVKLKQGDNVFWFCFNRIDGVAI